MFDLEPKSINVKSLGFGQTQERTLNNTHTENFSPKINNSESCHHVSHEKNEVLSLFNKRLKVNKKFNCLTGATQFPEPKGSLPMETKHSVCVGTTSHLQIQIISKNEQPSTFVRTGLVLVVVNLST